MNQNLQVEVISEDDNTGFLKIDESIAVLKKIVIQL